MPNNTFSNNSIIWVFQRNSYVFFWRLQCTKKLRNSPLFPREWSSIRNGSFLRFFLFLLPFRNSIMTNNTFSKISIIWVFQRNFIFILKIAMYQKIAKFSTLSTGVKLNHKWKFSSVFSLFITEFRNSIMPNNTFSKTSIIWVFQRNFIFFWRLQCTKKLRNSPLCPREWSSITNGSFLRFSLFLLPIRNSIMPNNIFSKNSIIWVFQRNFMFFFEDCNVPKNCEILHFVHGSEAQSQMEVFFDFFSFYYEFRNSIMTNNTFSKTSVIGVFQRNFILFLKIAMYQKIAKFSTLSTGVKLNHKWKFYWIFSLFITV